MFRRPAHLINQAQHLTSREIEELLLIRDIHLASIRGRSIAPSDFELNIAHLKQLKLASEMWVKVMMHHLENAGPYRQQLNFDTDRFIRDQVNNQISTLIKSANQAINEAKKIVFTTVNRLLKTELAKEPRIEALEYIPKNNLTFGKVEIKSDGYYSIRSAHIEETNKGTYSIKFSDGSSLTLQSLDDEEELNQARALFEDKMNELSPEHSLGYSASK